MRSALWVKTWLLVMHIDSHLFPHAGQCIKGFLHPGGVQITGLFAAPDSVTISGHSKKEERSDDDSKKYYFRSMDSSYEQSFNLPTKIDPDKAEAEFRDGVLTIKMPKANEVKPKQIEIK